MSYARIGPDSAVYVAGTDDAFVCYACRVSPKDDWFDNWRTQSREKLKIHLAVHTQVGQKVPKHTWERIDAELREYPERLTRNVRQCIGCNEVIESTSEHDLVWCKCEGQMLFVDGGLEYARYGGHLMGFAVDLTEYETRS